MSIRPKLFNGVSHFVILFFTSQPPDILPYFPTDTLIEVRRRHHSKHGAGRTVLRHYGVVDFLSKLWTVVIYIIHYNL